jgi:hypothetical protein
MRRSLLFVVLVAVGCTKSNPAAHCQNGTCTDPSFPFCDVSGVVGGEPGACIAATCTAGQFTECRDNAEVRCNATGDNYEVVQCERGCDAAADGCRLCNPSETACTNGKVATCDSSGAVVSQYSCPLGCFEAEPRCRDIVPSNGLAKFLDQVQMPVPLDLSGGGTINTTTGEIGTSAGTFTVPSFFMQAPAGGSPIRVFVASTVRLGNLDVSPAPDAPFGQGPALAIIATGDVSVEGKVSLSGTSDYASAGGVAFPGCVGGPPGSPSSGPATAGWGGGGHATAGGAGGEILGRVNGGLAGQASGTESLVPLRGGCASSGSGGGAIQISSATQIRVIGVINVNGGLGVSDPDSIGGGAAGGGILLEAPSVQLEANARLLANGGAGAAGNQLGSTSDTEAPASGGKCIATSTYCGAGGDGGSKSTLPGDGGTPPATNGQVTGAGGGGGSVGRIRINTADGTYVKSSGTIEAGALTTGKIATR